MQFSKCYRMASTLCSYLLILVRLLLLEVCLFSHFLQGEVQLLPFGLKADKQGHVKISTSLFKHAKPFTFPGTKIILIIIIWQTGPR